MSISKDKQKPLRSKLYYQFDAHLLYLVQEVSKRPSAEILNFFNELGKQVCDIGIENRTGRSIRKNLVEYFPGTSIPFRMLVKGYKSRQYRQHPPGGGAYAAEDEEFMSCYIEVGFPDKKLHVKSQDLDDIAVQLMERALLGGDEVKMAPFIRPEIKTPRMYKALMKAFSGRPEDDL